MNLSFNSHLRVGLYFFLVPPSVQLYVLEGKKTKSKFAALSNEDHMQQLLYWLLEGFICVFQGLFLCNLLSYSRLPCKDFRARSKNTSKGIILFFPQDSICGKHFPFMVMDRKQKVAQQSCVSKISIHFTAQKCNLRN